MSSVEVSTERFDAREHRLVQIVGALVAVVFALALSLAVTAKEVWDLRQLLNQRTPVIAAIDEAEIHTRCMNQLMSGFLALAAETIVAQDAERERLLPIMLEVVEKVREAASPDVDPCVVAAE